MNPEPTSEVAVVEDGDVAVNEQEVGGVVEAGGVV